ncbi:MAG: hypothetical protein ACRD0S_02315 [Acidimicrobiales bacterium]
MDEQLEEDTDGLSRRRWFGRLLIGLGVVVAADALGLLPWSGADETPDGPAPDVLGTVLTRASTTTTLPPTLPVTTRPTSTAATTRPTTTTTRPTTTTTEPTTSTTESSTTTTTEPTTTSTEPTTTTTALFPPSPSSTFPPPPEP